MPCILAIAVFICLMIVNLLNRAHANVLEPARDANDEAESSTGKLVFGEHWQAWADTITREAADPYEEQAA
jgi:hypothetical protein